MDTDMRDNPWYTIIKFICIMKKCPCCVCDSGALNNYYRGNRVCASFYYCLGFKSDSVHQCYLKHFSLWCVVQVLVRGMMHWCFTWYTVQWIVDLVGLLIGVKGHFKIFIWVRVPWLFVCVCVAIEEIYACMVTSIAEWAGNYAFLQQLG